MNMQVPLLIFIARICTNRNHWQRQVYICKTFHKNANWQIKDCAGESCVAYMEIFPPLRGINSGSMQYILLYEIHRYWQFTALYHEDEINHLLHNTCYRNKAHIVILVSHHNWISWCSKQVLYEKNLYISERSGLYKVSRLRLYKLRVLKYYVQN